MSADGQPFDGDHTDFLSPIAAGVTIDDLVLVRQLGEGAQGVVWEALQTTFDRHVAVKLMPPSSLRSDTQVERFKREAEAAGRLNHPNIVGTHSFKEWRGQYLIVQELLLGGDLATAIDAAHRGEGTRIDDLQDWAAATARDLAMALQFAHDHGVVHRDIKPGNVLLTEEGTPKITDFGLAKVEDDRGISRTGVAVGTPYYMSPEQVRAEANGIDHRTDIYSLGAVLYRMLAGRMPFTGKTHQGLLLDILTRDPEPIRKLAPNVDRDLEAVCLKCLEKEPSERYASAQDLADDLQRWQEGLGTSARPASVVSIPFRRMRRQATSGLVLMALLVPIAFFALDTGVLQDMAAADSRMHTTRQAALSFATIMFMWPLAVLARRLSGGRPLARVPAIGLCLALGASLWWSIHEQRLDQEQGSSRQRIERAIDNDMNPQTAAALDLHLAVWEQRFGLDDWVAIAHGYVSLGRFRDAEEWTLRTVGVEQDDPLAYALQFVVFDELGRPEDGIAALDAMLDLQLTGASRIAYLRVGDLLREAGNFALAADAYREAAKEPSIERTSLDFALAKLRYATCDFDKAWDDIKAAIRFRRVDMATNLLAHQIAVARQDWEFADYHLDQLTGWPLPYMMARYSYLQSRGERGAARDFLFEHVESYPDRGDILAAAAAAILRTGEIDDARRVYERLELVEDSELAGRIGLGAIAIQHAREELAQGRMAQAGSFLDEAQAQLKHALTFDPRHDIALYDLAQVAIFRNYVDHGVDLDSWPQEAWEQWLATTRNSLVISPGRDSSLNNAAYALGRLHLLTGDDDLLAEGIAMAEEAVRRATPSPETRCTGSVTSRADLSRNYDTESSLREWGGDLDGALLASQHAVSALATGDPGRDNRLARVADLQRRIADR